MPWLVTESYDCKIKMNSSGDLDNKGETCSDFTLLGVDTEFYMQCGSPVFVYLFSRS